MAKEEEKIITINGQDYLYNDLRNSIGTWGNEQGPKYKKWGKEGTNILEDTYELLDEMKDGTLEYNGLHFIDYTGQDRNRKKKNIKSNSGHGNYRNAAAFVLSQVIRGAAPITKGTQEDFEDFVHGEIARQIGSIENFLELDHSDKDIWPITNRYQSMTNVLNNLIDNEESYNKKYDIDEGYFDKLVSARNAFEDLEKNNNEMNLLEQLFSNKKNYIDNNYFKTDFSSPETKESTGEITPADGEVPADEENPVVTPKTDPYEEHVNNYFTDNDFESFSHNTNKISPEVLKIPIKGLKENLINLLCGALFENSKHSKSYSKVLKVFQEKGITEDDFLRYLLSKSIEYGFAKKISNTNNYYIPSIRHNKKLVFMFKIENNKIWGGFTNFINIPDFEEKLKIEYEKNPNVNIDKFIKKFFV